MNVRVRHFSRLVVLSLATGLLAGPSFAQSLTQCSPLTAWAYNHSIGFTQGNKPPERWQVVDSSTGRVFAAAAFGQDVTSSAVAGQPTPTPRPTITPTSFPVISGVPEPVALYLANAVDQINASNADSAKSLAAYQDAQANTQSQIQLAAASISSAINSSFSQPTSTNLADAFYAASGVTKAFVGPSTAPPTATAIVLHGLVNYRTYHVQLPCGTNSSFVTVTSITPPGVPIPPSNLKLISTIPLTFSWVPPPPTTLVDNGYTVLWSTSSKGPWTGIASGIASPGYSIPAGQLGGNVYLAVLSGNGRGVGPLSPRLPVTLVPATPSGVTSTNAQSTALSTAFGAVNITWNPSLGATSYNVAISSSSAGPFSQQQRVFSPSTTANVQGLNMGATYYFVVTALGPTGTSATSAPVKSTVGKFLVQ